MAVVLLALRASVAESAQVTPEPGSGPSGSIGPGLAPNSRDQSSITQGLPRQSAVPSSDQLTPEQCKSFLANWNSLPESRRTASINQIKTSCEKLTSSSSH
jgi:hypothetical protein